MVIKKKFVAMHGHMKVKRLVSSEDSLEMLYSINLGTDELTN